MFEAVVTYPTTDGIGAMGTIVAGSNLLRVLETVQDNLNAFPGSRVTLVRKPC